MQSNDENRTKSKTLRPLWGLYRFVRPYRLLAAVMLVVLVFTASVSLFLPFAFRQVIDSFSDLSNARLERHFAFALLLAGLLAVGSSLRYALITQLGERVVADIRKAAFARAISLSPAYYEKTLTGEVVSRLNTDTTLVLALVSSSVSFAMRNSLILAGGLVLMLITSPKLAVLATLVVPVVLVPILLLGRKLRTLSRENQDKIASGGAKASEVLLAVQAVQANTHENESLKQYDHLTEEAFLSAKRRIRLRAVMTAIIIFLACSGVAVVLWVGALDVREGLISAGELVQFVILAVMVAGAIAALSEIWGELLRAGGATERLLELLATEDTVRDPVTAVPAPEQVRRGITFEGVNFRYPMRSEMPALSNVTFTVARGQTVALVGPSGAGKSTIFQLLLRFFDPQAGRILIDETDIRDVERSSFRRLIALVPQETAIFADTARENIRFGASEATDAEVEEAAKMGDAHDFISTLPEGYDSYVGERGVMLSGGQKQRIAISRAFLRAAPILLFDEATSSLDAESERAVQQAVQKIAKGKTTIIIAHRLATVKNADRILVLDKGQIVAEGTHERLVKQDGLYARLAELQFAR